MIAVSFPEFVEIWNRAVQRQATPAHHVRIANWLEACWRSEHRELLLMAFRNSGKSTLVGLFAGWLLRGDANLRLLVLAADLALARKMVRNAKRVIERHPATRGLKPARRDQWAAERFTVNRSLELRDPSMLARGIQANLTGSRADVVICDDVEVPNTCDTAGKRADLRARLGEVEYVLTPGGLQLYVGTPHTYDTIYADTPREELGEAAPFLDGFRRLAIPLLGPDGESAWPERFSTRSIAQIRRHTGPNKFASQMMLRPVNIAEGRLDADRLLAYDGDLDYREAGGRAWLHLDGRPLVSASCWWDPAFGAAGEGVDRDGSVIAAVYTDDRGSSYLHRMQWLNRAAGGVGGVDMAGGVPKAGRRGAAGEGGAAGLVEEDEATRQCRAVAGFLKALHLPAVTVEINGIGRFLPGLLRQELRRAGSAAAVIEATSRRAKDQRILEAFDARLAAGALYAHRSVWATPFVGEMRDWRPGLSRGHDDGLDAAAGCLLSEPVRLGRPATPIRPPDWRQGAAAGETVSGFEVW
jgi:hypothetical protein